MYVRAYGYMCVIMCVLGMSDIGFISHDIVQQSMRQMHYIRILKQVQQLISTLGNAHLKKVLMFELETANEKFYI